MRSLQARNLRNDARSIAIQQARPKTQQSDYPNDFKEFSGAVQSGSTFRWLSEEAVEYRRRILAAGVPRSILIARGR